MATDIATLAIAVDSSDLPQGTQRLDQMGDQAAVTERQVVRASTNMSRGFSTTATAARGLTGSNGLRQVSMQLSQVAQQGMATGNFLQAFAIQAADIGLAFGTIGIAAGVAVGALTPLIASFLQGEQTARDFETVMDSLGDVMGGIENDSDILRMTVRELGIEYGDAAMRVRQFALAGAELRVQQLNDLLSDQVDVMAEATRQYRETAGTAFRSGTMLRDAIANIAEDFGVTRQEARELASLFRDLDQATTFSEQQDLLMQINQAMTEMGVSAADIPPDIRDAVLQMIELSNASDRAEQASARLSELAGVLNFDDAAASAARMAEQLGISLAAAQQIVALQGGGNAGRGGDPRSMGGSFIDWRTRNVPDSALRDPRTGGGSARAAEETTAAYRMAQQAIRQAQQAAVTFADVQSELDDLLASGAINAEEYAAALDVARDRLAGMGDAAQFWQEQNDTLKNGILDAIVAGDDLSETFQNLARSIARAALEAALFGTGPFSGGGNSTGILGSLFSGIFGGFRASGGGVNAGQAYVVGERGPELFAPGSSGTIIPNHAMGGGVVVKNEIINNAGVQVSQETSTGPNGEQINRLTLSQQRRNFATGEMDGIMRQRYGITPQGTRR